MRSAWGGEARAGLCPLCCPAKAAFRADASKSSIVTPRKKQKVSVHHRTDARKATERAFQAAVLQPPHDREPKPALRATMYPAGTIKNSAAVQPYHRSRLETHLYINNCYEIPKIQRGQGKKKEESRERTSPLLQSVIYSRFILQASQCQAHRRAENKQFRRPKKRQTPRIDQKTAAHNIGGLEAT